MSASGVMSWVRGAFWIVMAVASLQGCGGGGGGGDDSTTPVSPDRNSPLRLDGSNLSLVSTQGLRAAETTLKLAQQAIVEVSRLSRNGRLQMDSACLGNGTVHHTLIDADGNRVPTAGDTVKVDYTRCYVDYLGADYSGSIVIRLVSVDNARDGALSGTLDFGEGLVPFANAQGATWFGTLNFRRTVTELREELEVSASAANDLRRTFRAASSGTVAQVETFQRPQLVRVLQRETARASLSGSVTLASDRLGGRLDVSMDPQLSAYLDTHADSGSVRISGASNTRITLRADAVGSQNLHADLDTTGDGVAESTATLEWNSVFDGYLWSGDNLAAVGFLGVRNDRFLRLLSKPDFVQLQGVEVSKPLRLQFDRPLRSDSVLQAMLVDRGSVGLDFLYGVNGTALSEEPPTIAADVEFHGAVVLIRPRQGLQYGHNYQLLVSNIGNFTSAQGVTLVAAVTGAEIVMNVQLSFFNSDDMLWVGVSGAGNRSVVMPGIETSIGASVPLATSLPLSYLWSQSSGAPLTLSSTTTANITARLADGSAPGIGRAMLQLTVTDAIGRTSTVPVELQVANLNSLTSVLYFASSAGDFIGASQSRVYSAQTGNFLTDTTRGFLVVQYVDAEPGLLWSLHLSDASGGIPAVGTHGPAVNFFRPVSGSPGMDFAGNGHACNAAGSFTVLERVLDSTGAVQRLAIDFNQQCLDGNVSGPLRGSVRINSDLPIRP